jgi:hypothetical protein
MRWDHPGVAAAAQNLDTHLLHRRLLPGKIYLFYRGLHDRLRLEA